MLMGAPSKIHGARVAVDVLLTLADIGRGTRYKIADEIEHRTGIARSPESVRRANKPPQQRSGYGPTIWKLHRRLRYVA
jgi:hypothetical protein